MRNFTPRQWKLGIKWREHSVSSARSYTFDSLLLAFNPFSPSTKIHRPWAMTVSNPNDSASARTPSSKLPGCNQTLCIPFWAASWRDFKVTCGGVRKLKEVEDGHWRSEMVFLTGNDSMVDTVGLIGCTGRPCWIYHFKILFPNFLGSWLAP